jgi:flagellar protein FliO/FliZ
VIGAGPWLQSALALLVVLGLVAVAAWLARRSGLARPAGASALRPVASLSLGARERVVVVEVCGRWLVLGVAPGNVRALADLPPAPLPEGLPAPAFRDWLARARKSPKTP